MKQRSRDEIISLILQSASDGATQTFLMYEAYLSNEAIKSYLELLIEKGLLQYLSGEMRFKTTIQGMDYLKSMHSQPIQHFSCCNHQCKKCGVLYSCGEDAKCHHPFYHGVCNGCMKVFGYPSIKNMDIS